MTNMDNYCVIMGGGIGGRLAAKHCPNNFLTSSEPVVHSYNRPSTAFKR